MDHAARGTPMPRIAIVGGGIAGLTAAYELELARRADPRIDWHLFEATDRLGGTISTTRRQTPEGEYILEDGPDGWVTEKPWARELAEELGLGAEIIPCNEAGKKTYLYIDKQLVPLPDRMRLMVPEDLSALDTSPLFSAEAKQAYRSELTRAADLLAAIPPQDESVASFVRRHFGDEVLTKLAAPLLSGVFGGDVERLSVRAVMPAFVQMEREHGSLIAALQAKARTPKQPTPTFTTLRRGMGSLVEALTAQLPPERIHLQQAVREIGFDLDTYRWYIGFTPPEERPFLARLSKANPDFDHLIVATPLDAARQLLRDLDPYGTAFTRSRLSFPALAPIHASSALLATFVWPADFARTFTLPPGFGFLVLSNPDLSHNASSRPELTPVSAVERPLYLARSTPEPSASAPTDEPPQLLAATFTTQKFPHRAPTNARVIRAFFGGPTADALATEPDAAIAAQALAQLRTILGPLPDPTHTTVVRWPHSLPQYEVGHLDRMHELDEMLTRVPGLHLLGNSYHGVGVPDLIRDARTTARTLIQGLKT